jgi:hypothetical protein
MIAYYHAVRGMARRMARATERTVDALASDRIEQEPAFTDRMLGAIEESVDGYRAKGIRWEAKTLTDRGAGSEESKFGADFLGVLNIELPDFSIAKGFLAQAKLVRHGSVQNTTVLKQQCEKMLRLSPDSFVFLYSDEWVRVVPAVSVLGTDTDPIELYSRSAARFFEHHLECFIGDREIRAATPKALERLRERYNARSALWLAGREGDRDLSYD